MSEFDPRNSLLVKVMSVPIEHVREVFKLLGISTAAGYRKLGRDPIKVPIDRLPYLYSISGITPHELILKPPPDYEISNSGLSRSEWWSINKYVLRAKLPKRKYLNLSSEFKKHLKSVKDVVDVLDICRGEVGLVDLCLPDKEIALLNKIIKNVRNQDT